LREAKPFQSVMETSSALVAQRSCIPQTARPSSAITRTLMWLTAYMISFLHHHPWLALATDSNRQTHLQTHYLHQQSRKSCSLAQHSQPKKQLIDRLQLRWIMQQPTSQRGTWRAQLLRSYSSSCLFLQHSRQPHRKAILLGNLLASLTHLGHLQQKRCR